MQINELILHDERTFYIIMEVEDGKKAPDMIKISYTKVYKTIYGAFMNHPFLGVGNTLNGMPTKKIYAIYWAHPNDRDFMIPYHFEAEDAWYSGMAIIYKETTFKHLCTGVLEYERPVFIFGGDTNFAYLTYTQIKEDKEDQPIEKRTDFDTQHLVKGFWTNFWFMKDTSRADITRIVDTNNRIDLADTSYAYIDGHKTPFREVK